MAYHLRFVKQYYEDSESGLIPSARTEENIETSRYTAYTHTDGTVEVSMADQGGLTVFIMTDSLYKEVLENTGIDRAVYFQKCYVMNDNGKTLDTICSREAAAAAAAASISS